ncbi:MAG: helix-turn-helix transcriptional regulator [Syntrophales bacterium]|jgi:transcriptional regulator with XRE-family HTH domain
MNRLREARFFKRMNQYQLAISAGMHQSRISLIEKGYARPRPDEKKRLAQALGAKPEDLFLSEGDE